MDAIKKKMQAMKLEKDNALERGLVCEQQARDANLRAEKAEEEARGLQKKIQTVENDLDQTQEALMQVNAKLEEKNKNLQNVSTSSIGSFSWVWIIVGGWVLRRRSWTLSDDFVSGTDKLYNFIDDDASLIRWVNLE